MATTEEAGVHEQSDDDIVGLRVKRHARHATESAVFDPFVEGFVAIRVIWLGMGLRWS